MSAAPCFALKVSDVENVARRALGKGWKNDLEVAAYVRQSATRFSRSLNTLRAASAKGPKTKRARQYFVLRSLDARFCCLLLGWPEDVGSRPLAELIAAAGELNARKDCGEPITAYWKKKAVGGRAISIFGPKRRALQRLAREVLDASEGISPFDYCRKGRGANRAVLAMTSAAEEKGARWFSTSDIRDCYGSFDREKMSALIDLPKAVTENSILIPNDAMIILSEKDLAATSEQAVRRGLPQGSIASPAVAALLIRPVLNQLSGVLVLCHGDDIVTATQTKAECEANKHALAQACLEHPAGPLLMKTNAVAMLGTPIDCLGYRLVRRWKQYGGGVRLRPSPAAYDKFYARLEKVLLATCHWSDDLNAKAAPIVAAWQAGLSLWDRSRAGDDLVWLHLNTGFLAYIRKRLMMAAKAGIYSG